MRKGRSRVHQGITLTATIVLLLGILILFSGALFLIERNTVSSCFSRLQEAAVQVSSSVRRQVMNDRNELWAVADLLSFHIDEDSLMLEKHVESLKERGSLTAIALYLSDGSFITPASLDIPEPDRSFSDEADRCPYISDIVSVSKDGSEVKMIYQAVPVIREGRALGIVYGYMDLSVFASMLDIKAFGGNCQIYVADSDTGDYLVDTWHKNLGNVFDDEMMTGKVKPGYDYAVMKDDFRNGREGHIAFWSNTAGEYFYSYYTQVGINRWMSQVTVPESIAFAEASKTRHIIYMLLLLIIILMICYLAAVRRRLKKDEKRRDEQLEVSRYMYDVQQLLFDAHKDQEVLKAALRKVSRMLTAEKSFFIVLSEGRVYEYVICSGGDCSGENLMSAIESRMYSLLSEGKSILIHDNVLTEDANEAERRLLQKLGIRNLMMVPVLDNAGKLTGILGCVGMHERFSDCFLLECVAQSFRMAMSNLFFYREIERISMTDALTGLANRMSYELYLEKPVAELPLCCLFIDVNGLHELNNTSGHAEGDRMLSFIAGAVSTYFSTSECFRIGGDEIVIFTEGHDTDYVAGHRMSLESEITSGGYSVSIGEAWAYDPCDKKVLVNAAEKKMYDAKRTYYMTSGKDRRNRR